MELFLFLFFICFTIFMIQVQKWYSSYLREKKREERDREIYVMNLKERKIYEMSQDPFISFVRFLFLFSLFSDFFISLIKELFKYLKYMKFLMFKEKLLIEEVVKESTKKE